MANDWNDYQEEAALFFRSMGLDPETNITLNGVSARDGLNKWPIPTLMRHNTLIILCRYFDAGACSDCT